MKRTFLLFVQCCLTAALASAQTINGDLNHNNRLDVGDVTKLVDTMLKDQPEYVSGCTCKDATISIPVVLPEYIIDNDGETEMSGGEIEGPVEIYSSEGEVLNIYLEGETLPVLDNNGNTIGTVNIPNKFVSVRLPDRIEGMMRLRPDGRVRTYNSIIIPERTIVVEAEVKK